jgi:hypothetical protein
VRLARIAARQHGVVSRRQLLAIGVDDHGIRVRIARGGLHRVHSGVFALGHPGLTREGRWMAAVVACGQGALLSHPDAAALWEFYDDGRRSHAEDWRGLAGARPVHVTVKSHRKVPGLILHRTRRLHPDDVAERDGIPVTSVARTFVDLTDFLSEDRLLRALREAEFKKLLDLDALNAAVERAHGDEDLQR